MCKKTRPGTLTWDGGLAAHWESYVFGISQWGTSAEVPLPSALRGGESGDLQAILLSNDLEAHAGSCTV